MAIIASQTNKPLQVLELPVLAANRSTLQILERHNGKSGGCDQSEWGHQYKSSGVRLIGRFAEYTWNTLVAG